MLAPHDALNALVAGGASGVWNAPCHHHNVAAQVVQAGQRVALQHFRLQGPHLVEDVDHLGVRGRVGNMQPRDGPA